MRRLLPLLALVAVLPACRGGRLSRDGWDAAPPATGTGTPVAVPDVRGRGVGAARSLIERAGLRVGAVEPWPDALGYPAGTVVAQRPARNSIAPTGSNVDLRVYGLDAETAARLAASRSLAVAPTAPTRAGDALPSGTPPSPGETATVPDLVGHDVGAATGIARRAGFDVVVLRVPGAPSGRVLSQDVAAGGVAPAGTPIGVRVASGETPTAEAPPAPPTDAVPGVPPSGDAVPGTPPPADAVPNPPPSVAESAPPAPDASNPPPFVTPADGSSGAVTADDGKVLVPPMLDRTAAQARRLADDVGLRYREEPAAAGVPGRVMDQSPAAGERVAPGTEVVVRIPPVPVAPDAEPTTPGTTPPTPTPTEPSAPPAAPADETVIVPSVLDKTQPVARRILEDSGFAVREEAVPNGIAGRVMDQVPLPGDRARKGSEVVLRIPGWVPAEPPAPAPVAVEPPTEPTPPPVEPPATPIAPPPAAPPADVSPPSPVPPRPAEPPAPAAPPAAAPVLPPAAPPDHVPSPPPPPPVAAGPRAPMRDTIPESDAVPNPPPYRPPPAAVADRPPAPEPTPLPPLPGSLPPSSVDRPTAPLTVPPSPDAPAPPPEFAPTIAPRPEDLVPDVPRPAPVEPPPAPRPLPTFVEPNPDAPAPSEPGTPPDVAPPPPVPAPPAPAPEPPVPTPEAAPTEPPSPPTPPTSPSPTEPTAPTETPTTTPRPSVARTVPAPAPVPPAGEPIAVPVTQSPADGATLANAAAVRIDFAWSVVPGADGYLLEMEESVGGTWTPLLRKIVRSPSVAVEIEPAKADGGDFRWRVRATVGRRGGRASAWTAVRVH